jgi:hypothetical protein
VPELVAAVTLAAAANDSVNEAPVSQAGFRGRTPALPPACRRPETALDAEANDRETKLHQALPSSAGNFAAQYLRVSSGENNPNTLLKTPAAQDLLPGGELSEQSW